MIVNLSRRKFLQHLASNAACLALVSPTTVFAITNKYKGDAGDLLSFTELQGLGPEINSDFVDGDYIALHKERELPANIIDEAGQSRAERLLREMFDKQGWHWDKNDSLLWTYQHYGTCDHSQQCYKLLSYCLSAQDFLYDTVQGLLDASINWDILNQDFNYSIQRHNNFNGFIGRYTYLVHRLNLLDQHGWIKEYGLTNVSPVNRAINYITTEDYVPDTSLIYIIPGQTSLISPFSELIHITTHGPSVRLARELGVQYNRQQAGETSRIIGETITESAAILVAQNYLTKYNHAEQLALVNYHANNLGGRFSLVPETVAYMKQHGVQQTLNTYTDDPVHLVNEISKSLE